MTLKGNVAKNEIDKKEVNNQITSIENVAFLNIFF